MTKPVNVEWLQDRVTNLEADADRGGEERG